MLNAKKRNLFMDFYNAILENDIEIVKSFLEKDKRVLTLKNEWGDTLLHQFCHYEELPLEMINLFLENGLDPNIKDNAGKTALYYACCNKNTTIPVIKALLNKGAELDCKNTTLKLINIVHGTSYIYDTDRLRLINNIFPPLTEEKNANNKRPLFEDQNLNSQLPNNSKTSQSMENKRVRYKNLALKDAVTFKNINSSYSPALFKENKENINGNDKKSINRMAISSLLNPQDENQNKPLSFD